MLSASHVIIRVFCLVLKKQADPELVQDLLLELHAQKSLGPTGIHPRVLKELANITVGLLCIIFQWSWESREIPVDWKLASAVPVFKQGKQGDPGNYMPVSLTSVPGTITGVILGVTEKHLRDNTAIGHSQRGFMRGTSCLTNLISCYDKVTHLVTQGSQQMQWFWILAKLLILSLTGSFWTKCPAHS